MVIIIISFADVTLKPVCSWKFTFDRSQNWMWWLTIKIFKQFHIRPRYVVICICICIWISLSLCFHFQHVSYFHNVNEKKAFLEIKFVTFGVLAFFNADIHVQCQMPLNRLFTHLYTTHSNVCVYWEILDRYVSIRNLKDKKIYL